jgi:hypothetical protein
MAHSDRPVGPFRPLPWGLLASALVGTSVVAAAPARAEPIDPFVRPEVIAAVGGDPSFRGTIGYDMTLSQAKQVFRLGFWDDLADGLLSHHTVSVFDGSSGALLASGVVPAGTGALLEDGFRWVAIPAIVLSPGRYVIGASMDGDPSSFDGVITDASSIATRLGVTFGPQQALISAPVAPGVAIAATLMPTLPQGEPGYFGPAMAPGPLPLFGVSAGWLWSRRLRARCRQRDGV